MNGIIFSCQQNFFRYAADEFKQIDASARIIEGFKGGGFYKAYLPGANTNRASGR